MDTDAFLPLMSDELTTQVHRRVVQFGGIVDDVVGLLIEKKVANTKGADWSGSVPKPLGN